MDCIGDYTVLRVRVGTAGSEQLIELSRSEIFIEQTVNFESSSSRSEEVAAHFPLTELSTR